MNKKTLYNYLDRDSFPLWILQELYGSNRELLAEIPRDIQIGVKRDDSAIERFITLDEELACLIGYYTAEGFTRITDNDTRGKTTTGVRQVDFAATEEQAREFIMTTLEKKFNISEPYTEDKRITASGTLFTLFFEDIVNGGRLAHTKAVPEIIKDSSDDIKGAYLSGYISGDGYRRQDNGEIGYTTVSEDLSDDLYDLLRSLGYTSMYITKNKPVLLREKFPDYYDESDESMSRPTYVTKLSETESDHFVREYGIQIQRKEHFTNQSYDLKYVESISQTSTDVQATYNITITNTHRLETNITVSNQCDGDEDSIMLMLDGLLNFSRTFLPDSIGRTMDAPLVNTSVLEPSEIDDEAYNVDMVDRYSRDFYLKTWERPGPKEVDVQVIEDVLDDPRGVKHTTEVNDINRGPYQSAYSTGGSMDEKVEGQLELASISRAADEKMVGTKIIRKHFFPDLKGNLRSYAQQEVRCTKCNEKYRRPPLADECTECDDGGNLIFTVHEGSVRKYLPNVLDIKDEYGVESYLEQEIEETRKEVESIFEMDTEEQTGLEDFL
jgi:DNA polymerase II large subunit